PPHLNVEDVYRAVAGVGDDQAAIHKAHRLESRIAWDVHHGHLSKTGGLAEGGAAGERLRKHNQRSNQHPMFSSTHKNPAAAPGCFSGMGCEWKVFCCLPAS